MGLPHRKKRKILFSLARENRRVVVRCSLCCRGLFLVQSGPLGVILEVYVVTQPDAANLRQCPFIGKRVTPRW